MITHIFHIADIHIRSGNTEQSRFHEFKSVFDNFYQDIQTHPSVESGSAIVVVAGDVFHNKLKIESPGLKLALEFFKNIGSLCPVYIIGGNHDFRQDKPDEPDLIPSLLHLKNINYIDKTGTFVVDNIGFGIVTVKDLLQKGSTSGLSSEVPVFPEANFDENVTCKVGLLHGNIQNYPSSWIPREYDIVLLGDIHIQSIKGGKCCKYQNTNYNPKNSYVAFQNKYSSDETVLGYAGSVIQQDYGESLWGHGYLLWDIEEKTVTTYHLKNDCGFVTTRLDKGKDAWDIAVKGTNKWQPLAALVHQPWFPRNISIRVILDNKTSPLLLKRARDDFGNYDLKIQHITPMTTSISNVNAVNVNKEGVEVVSFNTTENWIEYVSDKVGDTYNVEWKKWFLAPETMLIPSSNNLVLNAKIEDRNNKIMKKIKSYFELLDNKKISKTSFELKTMKWNWILCFKSDNWFNFEDIKKNGIATISAKNGVGKTSLLETICIALYGEGFPSRSTKSYTSSIICQDKPAKDKANTSIYVKLGNDTYRIQRTFNLSPNDSTKLVIIPKETTVDRVLEENAYQNLFSGKTAVDSWVDLHIGKISSFLMSCMVSQNSDNDFFQLKPQEQKDMLDQSLDIESCTSFQGIMKETKLAYNAISELAEATLSTSNFCLDHVNIDEIDDTIKNKTTALDEKKHELYDIMREIPNKCRYTEQLEDNDNTNDTNIDIERLNNDIEDKKKGIDYYKKTLKSQLDIKSNAVNDIHDELNALKDKIKPLKYWYEGYTIKDYKVEEIKNKIYFIENSIGITEGIDFGDKFIKLKNKIAEQGINPHKFNKTEYIELENKFKNMNVSNLSERSTKIQETDMMCNDIMTEYEAKKILKESKPEYKNLPEGTSISGLVSELHTLSTSMVKLVNEEPIRNKTMVTKSIDEINAALDKVSQETDITKLENVVRSLEQILDNYQTKLEKITLLKKENTIVCSAPYNKDCWACQLQSWKKQSEKLKESIKTIEEEISKILKQMKNSSGYDTVDKFTKYISILKEHIQNLNEKQAFEWNEHKNNTKELMNSINKKEAEIKWAKWQVANQTISKHEMQDIELYNKYKKLKLVSDFLHGELYVFKQMIDHINNSHVIDTYETAASMYMKLGKFELEYNILQTKKTKLLENKKCTVLESIKHIEDDVIELQIKRNKYIENEKHIQDLKDLQHFSDNINTNFKVIDNIYTVFSGFKEWVYTNKVIPYLTDFANNIISVLCDTRPIQLVGKMYNGNPVWFMNDVMLPPIEKASGFQKFVIGIAMRIALSKFGSTGILCSQLFIDEGFTACDSENIVKVPVFLKQLLLMYPNGIVLVSHMDDIKICANLNINLNRNNLESTTLCQYGVII